MLRYACYAFILYSKRIQKLQRVYYYAWTIFNNLPLRYCFKLKYVVIPNYMSFNDNGKNSQNKY